MTSVASNIGINTPVVVMSDGEKWEVPVSELDKEDRQQLRHILWVLDQEDSYREAGLDGEAS